MRFSLFSTAVVSVFLAGCGTSIDSSESTPGSIHGPHEVPRCLNIGTRSEGWYLKGKLLRWTSCADKGIACMGIGSRSEGWYDFEVKNSALVRWDFCFHQAQPPKCVNVGTRSEGWSGVDAQGKPWLKWDNCAKRSIVCQAVGTRSEGWYSMDKMEPRLVGWDRCSSVEIR